MIVSKEQRISISYYLTHALYSLTIFYGLLMVLDVASGGMISRIFKSSLLLGLAALIVLALSLTNKETPPKKETIPFRLYALVAVMIGIYLFLALRPHDTLSALGAGLLSTGLLIFNYRRIYKQEV